MENELDKEKKQYELAVLLDNESGEGATAGILANNQAEVYQRDNIKTINLAYSIKRHTTASLVVYCFYSLPSNIEKIESELRFHSNVIRYLLVTPPIQRSQKLSQDNKEKESKINPSVDIKPPKTESISNEMLEETLEKILQ